MIIPHLLLRRIIIDPAGAFLLLFLIWQPCCRCIVFRCDKQVLMLVQVGKLGAFGLLRIILLLHQNSRLVMIDQFAQLFLLWTRLTCKNVPKFVARLVGRYRRALHSSTVVLGHQKVHCDCSCSCICRGSSCAKISDTCCLLLLSRCPLMVSVHDSARAFRRCE